jgi:outer membrane protein
LKVKFLVLATLMSALFVTGATASELKVGYVNTQRIFRDAPAAQKAAKKLEGEFAKRDQDLQRMSKQLQGLQENLEKKCCDNGRG